MHNDNDMHENVEDDRKNEREGGGEQKSERERESIIVKQTDEGKEGERRVHLAGVVSDCVYAT